VIANLVQCVFIGTVPGVAAEDLELVGERAHLRVGARVHRRRIPDLVFAIGEDGEVRLADLFVVGRAVVGVRGGAAAAFVEGEEEAER